MRKDRARLSECYKDSGKGITILFSQLLRGFYCKLLRAVLAIEGFVSPGDFSFHEGV